MHTEIDLKLSWGFQSDSYEGPRAGTLYSWNEVTISTKRDADRRIAGIAYNDSETIVNDQDALELARSVDEATTHPQIKHRVINPYNDPRKDPSRKILPYREERKYKLYGMTTEGKRVGLWIDESGIEHLEYVREGVGPKTARVTMLGKISPDDPRFSR